MALPELASLKSRGGCDSGVSRQCAEAGALYDELNDSASKATAAVDAALDTTKAEVAELHGVSDHG